MSKPEIEPRTVFDSSPSPHPPAPSSAAPGDPAAAAPNAAIDIGRFVSAYNSMLVSLYPLELAASALLYIFRSAILDVCQLTCKVIFVDVDCFYIPQMGELPPYSGHPLPPVYAVLLPR